MEITHDNLVNLTTTNELFFNKTSGAIAIPLSQFQNSDSPTTIFTVMYSVSESEIFLVSPNNEKSRIKKYSVSNPLPTADSLGFIPSITFDPNLDSDKWLVMKFKKPLNQDLEVVVEKHESFVKYERNRVLLSTFMIGFFFTFILATIAFCFIVKDYTFLCYCCFVVFSLSTFTPYATAARVILEDIPQLFLNKSLLFCFALASSSLFTSKFLKIKSTSKLLHKVLNTFATICFVLGAYSILSLNISLLPTAKDLITPSNFIVLLFSLVTFCSAISFKQERYRSAAFLLSWMTFLGPLIIWALGARHYIPKSEYIFYAMNFGFFLQPCILIFGLWSVHSDKIQAVIKQKQTNKLRSLLRVICHDSVNLLNLTQFQVSESLQRDDLDENSKLAWNKVKLSTENQLELLEQVKELDAIESDKKEIELRPTSLKEAIEQSIQVFENRLHSKKLNIKVEIEDNLPNISAEPVSLSNSVINNLISNAIKFSFPLSTIKIKAYSKDKRVFCEISDSGIGIPENILRNIFSPQVATSRKGTDNELGTGFGMPLIKMTMDNYNGSILIESKTQDSYPTDHGSKFILSFNISNGKHKSAEAEHKNLFDQIDHNMKILVVDDDQDVLDMFGVYKKKLKLNFDRTPSFSITKEKLQCKEYDFCFIDQNLGHIQASEIIKELKSISPKTKFVMMTGDFQMKEEKVKKMGFNNLLLKPINAHKLEDFFVEAS